MFRELVAVGFIGASLGCGRETKAGATLHSAASARVEPKRAVASTSATMGVRFAAMDASSDARAASEGASVRVTAVQAAHTATRLDGAPLVDESIALVGTRTDGTTMTSFRRGRDAFVLSGLRDDEVIWVRAVDTEAEDGAPPLALIGVTRGALDDDEPVRVAIDVSRPPQGRATVVARLLDSNGAPRAGVRVSSLPDTEGPRVDDARGDLVSGDTSGPRGVVVYDDVDPSRHLLPIALATARGRSVWSARVEAGVTTTLVIELDD